MHSQLEKGRHPLIDISLRSGKYTKKQLDKKLSRYIKEQQDIDLFTEALIKTGQVTKQKRAYILPLGKQHKYTTPNYYTLPTYIYGGRGRTGVRGGKEWIDERGYPTGMFLSKALVNGEWVDIKEKPKMLLVKGRRPETSEAWRAQVPTDIQRKYGITQTTELRVRVDETTYEYITSLKLWGYQYGVMLSYGETKEGANTRFLELGGQNFTNSVKKDISDTIKRDQKQIKNIILKLLSDADSEYYGLYEETDNAGNVGENIEATPLVRRNPLIAKVELRDLKNGRVIVDWDTVSEKSKIPSPSDFRVNIHINQEIASARGQTALDIKWKNKGGFD